MAIIIEFQPCWPWQNGILERGGDGSKEVGEFRRECGLWNIGGGDRLERYCFGRRVLRACLLWRWSSPRGNCCDDNYSEARLALRGVPLQVTEVLNCTCTCHLALFWQSDDDWKGTEIFLKVAIFRLRRSQKFKGFTPLTPMNKSNMINADWIDFCKIPHQKILRSFHTFQESLRGAN